MAEYINIKGTNVETLASDPANPTVGQIWYNSTSNALKGSVYAAGSWATGGALPTAKRAMASAGIQTAALSAGGTLPPNGSTATSEEYNGSSWSGGGTLGTSRDGLRGAGTQTAAVVFGGATPAYTGATEEYDGSTWSPGGSLTTARVNLISAGTQTAALAWAGNPGTPPYSSTETEEYDGSTWTAGGTFPTSLGVGMGSAGIQTAALSFGGELGEPTYAKINTTQSYDGSSWTTLPATLNTTRYFGTGFGTQTAAVAVAGVDPAVGNTSTTEEYDGVSWTTSANASLARANLGGAGTRSAGLIFGGFTAPPSVTGNKTETEEWTGAGPVTQTITSS